MLKDRNPTLEFMIKSRIALISRSQGISTCVDDILITNVIGYIGAPATPLTFGLCFLRNFMKRPVASSYVDSAKLLIDDNYDCMIDEIIDPRAALCDRYDAVLGDVSRDDTIKWPQAYVITVGE
ncbi:hypothetical protein C5167_016000 [Papaver somniferum]|nr:hypothetical protein C5167_016000 [Papaver somniferum]